MRNIEEMKNYIRKIGQVDMVKELVTFGWELEPALGWVYDMFTLTKEEFKAKHFQ